jgi:hypothetical protein
MLDAIAFFVRHHSELIAVAISIHAVAAAIVNLTPTPRDDVRLRRITRVGIRLYRLLEIIVGIWTKNAKS